MTKFRRLLAALLAVCIALSLAACGDTSWICEVDGNAVAAGVYIYYQTEGYGDALYQLVQEDSETYTYPYIYYYNMGYIEPTVFDVTMSDGKTVEEYINEYALDMCKQNVIVDKLFADLGLEITDDEAALVDSQVRSAWQNNGEGLEKIGVSEESLRQVITSKIKETKVFDEYYEVGGRNGTTEDEITDYFADNYARIKYMTFTFADNADDAIDETRKNEQLELANSYLAEAESGVSMDELIKRHNDEVAAEAAEEAETAEDDGAEGAETEDTETDTEAEADTEDEAEAEVDEYENENILSKESTYPTEKFVNYVFTAVKVGEFSVVQDDTCFYVVQRLDVKERTDIYDSYRDAIMQELFDDDYTKLMNTELEKYDVKVNDKSVKRYKTRSAFPEVFGE